MAKTDYLRTTQNLVDWAAQMESNATALQKQRARLTEALDTGKVTGDVVLTASQVVELQAKRDAVDAEIMTLCVAHDVPVAEAEEQAGQ